MLPELIRSRHRMARFNLQEAKVPPEDGTFAICNARNASAAGLYGLLVGDALGVPYEFFDASGIPEEHEIELEPPKGFRRAHAGVPGSSLRSGRTTTPMNTPSGSKGGSVRATQLSDSPSDIAHRGSAR